MELFRFQKIALLSARAQVLEREGRESPAHLASRRHQLPHLVCPDPWEATGRPLELGFSHAPERHSGLRDSDLCLVSLGGFRGAEGLQVVPTAPSRSVASCIFVLFEELQVEGSLDQIQAGSSFRSSKTFRKGAYFSCRYFFFSSLRSAILFSEIGFSFSFLNLV